MVNMTQVKIIGGALGGEENDSLEEAANKWLSENEKEIEVQQIKLHPTSDNNGVLLIIYGTKAQALGFRRTGF